MITLLRKIRRSLIESGATRKYLLYAIGEIVLVVIGILIALQINNWNENVKESQTERKLLIQLQRDLQKCHADLEGNIRIHDRVNSSANILINYMNSNLPYHDSLANHFASAFLWSRLIIDEGAYETIKSHGLDIISNSQLRDQIVSQLEGRLYFLRELERLTIDYCEELRRDDFASYFVTSYADFGPHENGFSWGKSVPLNYEQLKKDQSFKYHLTTFLNLSKTLQSVGHYTFLRELEELISIIQDEIAKRK